MQQCCASEQRSLDWSGQCQLLQDEEAPTISFDGNTGYLSPSGQGEILVLQTPLPGHTPPPLSCGRGGGRYPEMLLPAAYSFFFAFATALPIHIDAATARMVTIMA